jgi:hypothetical protein
MTQFDLFLPEGAPSGLLMFIHGGYWLKFDRESWSHLAAGAVARGRACAVPSYTLAPEARIAAMTKEIASAVGVAAGLVSGPGRRHRRAATNRSKLGAPVRVCGLKRLNGKIAAGEPALGPGPATSSARADRREQVSRATEGVWLDSAGENDARSLPAARRLFGRD